MGVIIDPPVALATTGSTGTKNSPTVTGYIGPMFPVDAAAFQMVVEAVGATPTITFKIVGSMDTTRWYDLAYVTDASDTLAVTAITFAPAAGAGKIIYLANPVARQYKYWAVVVSANTNVTYRCELHPII